MDPTTPTSVAIWPVFIQGLALSFGLIVAIGAQNAFVLRQGLRREHVGSVVLFCATADAVLIMAGVFGMAQALGDRPDWARALALAGALFLAWYGWQALMRMRNPDRLQASSGGEGLKKGAAMAQAAAFTLLNPHVYLDTVLLLGSMASPFAGMERAAFAAGASLASAVWFITLGWGARWLAPLFATPQAWRILDAGIALLMLGLAALLLRPAG